MSVLVQGLLRLLAPVLVATLGIMPALANDTVPPPPDAGRPVATDAPDPTPHPADLREVSDPGPVDLLRLGFATADQMTVAVTLSNSDSGPYPFIIDTGSHRSIVSTELARRLALPELPPVEIISLAGRETVAAVQLDQMQFGTQVVNDLPVLSISHENLGSAGLIGLDGLKDKRVTLDFRKRQLTVGKSMPARRRWDRNVIVVEGRSKFGQLILVNSLLDGRRVSVILDTGAEYSVGNMALFRNLRAKKLVVPPEKIMIKSVTGQEIEAQFAVVNKLEIDSVVLTNVPMIFLDALPFAELDLADRPAMLLGMKMLRMFPRVTIDFGSRHVDFEIPEGSDTAVRFGALVPGKSG